jgi:hypothetical protein
MIVYNYDVHDVDVVLRLAEGVTLKELAEEGLNLLGEGNPDATQVEAFLPTVNTPVFDGYVTLRVFPGYAHALQYISDNNLSDKAELIRIEWPACEEIGGEMVPYVYPPIEYEEAEFDEAGKQVGTRLQGIGIIGR